MYEIDVYLSNMKAYDSARPDQTDWLYYLPDALWNKLCEHENWLIKCDFISLSSNISTSDGYALFVYNDQSKERYTHHFEPSMENSITEIKDLISNILSLDEVIKLCGSEQKIWSFILDPETKHFKLGKSKANPPSELKNKLYIFMSKRLGEKLGFPPNTKHNDMRFDYGRLPYIGTNFPNALKYYRRFYLVGDFVQSSILNDGQSGIITSFNNPHHFDSKPRYGFDDPIEIDRSQTNHWVNLIKGRMWRISLKNELMENLTVVSDHDIHLKFRLKPAPIL